LVCARFLDAAGGGRWGPLVERGAAARFATESTNGAEVLVAVTISATFVITMGLEIWPVILGLVLRGVIAAPLAAYASRWISDS